MLSRSKLAILLALACLLMLAGSANADVKSSTESAAMYFSVSQDSAYIDSSITFSLDSHAHLTFSLKWDTTGVPDIGVVQAEMYFDAENLAVFDVTSTANWTGDFEYDVSTIGDTLGVLFLEFTDGDLEPPDNFVDLAEIVFKAKCQPELNVNDIVFEHSPRISYVLAGNNKYYPPAGNWTDGAVIIHDYYAIITLPEVELSGAMGTTQTIDISASTNFCTYIVQMMIQYDGDKLDYVTISRDTALWTQAFATEVSDGLLKIILVRYGNAVRYGCRELDDEPFVHVDFELECDLVNDTVAMSFWQDSCVWMPNSKYWCNEDRDIGSDFTDAGFISNLEFAALAGWFDSGPVSYYDNDIEADLVITSYNSFPAGKKSSGDSPIVINLNMDGYYDYNDDDGPLTFEHVVQNDSLLSLRQTWAGSVAVWDSSTVSVDRHTVTLDVDLNGFTPTWNLRCLPPPSYVDSFAQAYGHTGLADTLGCLTATQGSGALVLDPITPLEVMVGQFYTQSVNSANNCAYQNLYVRDNFPMDSLYVVVSVRAGAQVWAENMITGIEDSTIAANSVLIRSNGNLPTIDSTGLVYIARLQYRGYLGCGTTCNLQVAFTNAHMFGATVADSQFVHLQVGSVTVHPLLLCKEDFEELDENELRSSEDEDDTRSAPTEFALRQNYPNPFNPVTSIAFDMPTGGSWNLRIYNIAGQLIDERHGSSAAGTVEITWDASQYASGVYLYRLEAGEFAATRKMLLIK